MLWHEEVRCHSSRLAATSWGSRKHFLCSPSAVIKIVVTAVTKVELVFAQVRPVLFFSSKVLEAAVTEVAHQAMALAGCSK